MCGGGQNLEAMLPHFNALPHWKNESYFGIWLLRFSLKGHIGHTVRFVNVKFYISAVSCGGAWYGI
jgi:hypothetical protein